MARRRMIDPNIWTSEDMSRLSIRQRLLVVGLFSNADDHGKGKGNPAFIRSTVFPYDDFKIQEIQDDISAIQKVINIKFYEVEGNSYYVFSNWKKWQTVQKPQKSIIPDPVENDSGMIHESVENDSSVDVKGGKSNSRLKEEKGRERKGSSSNENTAAEPFLELLNSFCSLHGRLDIHVKVKERELMQELVSEIPLDFIMDSMNKIHNERSKETNITSFLYYKQPIKEAWKIAVENGELEARRSIKRANERKEDEPMIYDISDELKESMGL